MADTYLVNTIFAQETEIARLREYLEKIDRKAEAGICCSMFVGAREFLKDVRKIVAEAKCLEKK